LSIASDVNGSIRTPASFCGLFAHKPTFGLTPNEVGPMCRFSDDLEPLLKVLVGETFLLRKRNIMATLGDLHSKVKLIALTTTITVD